MSKLMMPENLIGETLKGNEYVKTKPRKWTDGEIEWVKKCREEGHSLKEISEASGRSEVSLSIKLKRLNKQNDTYNKDNRELKYVSNALFLDTTKPESVLDLFAGKSFYENKGIRKLVTNDKDEKFHTTHNKDALVLLCELYAQGQRFDLVDIDPYGSPYSYLDLSMKIAKKYLVVSFGEWGHRRWKRYEFVKPRYGISDFDSFTLDAFIMEVQRIAETNKKFVEPVDVIKYENFVRVYFNIERLKITEQWEG